VGHVQKRVRDGKASYRARVRTPDKREVSRTFRRKVDADQWVREQETRPQRGEWLDPAAGKLPFGEWLDRWAETRHGRRSTLARDESYMRNHLRPAWADTPLSAIRQPDVVEWVGQLQAKGLAPATVGKAYQLLAAAMQAAVDAELIAASPCRNVPLPKVERYEMRFLDHAEIARLADATDPRYRALVLVLAYGGLRIGEAAALRTTRLLPTRRELDIAETVAWVKGHPDLGPPKSKAGRRPVALPAPVWAELTAHVDTYATEWVFPAPAGGLLQPSHFRRRVWAPATKAAGLEGLRVHDLRHTAVSLWIEAGADVKRVATRAGHTSVAFTLDRYGHLYPDADAALADRLGEAMAAARDGAEVVALRPGP
jgi:integrase